MAHSLASGAQEQERRQAEPQGTVSQQWDSWHTEPQNLRQPLDTWHVGIETPQEGNGQQPDKNGQNKVQLDQHSAVTVLFDQWLTEWEVESDPHCKHSSQALTEEQVLFDQWLTDSMSTRVSSRNTKELQPSEEVVAVEAFMEADEGPLADIKIAHLPEEFLETEEWRFEDSTDGDGGMWAAMSACEVWNDGVQSARWQMLGRDWAVLEADKSSAAQSQEILQALSDTQRALQKHQWFNELNTAQQRSTAKDARTAQAFIAKQEAKIRATVPAGGVMQHRLMSLSGRAGQNLSRAKSQDQGGWLPDARPAAM